MKFYIIAGEASGDLHASNLIKWLKIKNPDVVFRGRGGDLMEAQGVHITRHYREMAFMGFAEVLVHLPVILKNLSECKADILSYKPDALILVDYPGFNLRIASWAKAQNIKVIYYISPQVWAWKANRVQLIKKVVDKMLVILPFEKDFYKKYNMEVDFVGHPLLDVIDTGAKPDEDTFRNKYNIGDKTLVALLPGSRKQEIGSVLPVMLEAANHFPECRFVIGAAPSIEKDWYDSFPKPPHVAVVYGMTYPLLSSSDAALVTSGTATLETALFGAPETICYKTSGIAGTLSYLLARKLIGKRLKYIGMVNLIMNKEVVKEWIQHDLTSENIAGELKKLITDVPYRERMKNDFNLMREKLGGAGASEKAAAIITEFLRK
jgi:lipid-A-disaccharide synthase